MDFVHNPYRCGPLRVGMYGCGVLYCGQSILIVAELPLELSNRNAHPIRWTLTSVAPPYRKVCNQSDRVVPLQFHTNFLRIF